MFVGHLIYSFTDTCFYTELYIFPQNRQRKLIVKITENCVVQLSRDVQLCVIIVFRAVELCCTIVGYSCVMCCAIIVLYINLAFHLIQDVRGNLISPIHHKTDNDCVVE